MPDLAEPTEHVEIGVRGLGAHRRRDRDDGEISVSASLGGKRLTTDPIRTGLLRVAVRELESSIACGFPQMWVSGETNEEPNKSFELTVGRAERSRRKAPPRP